MASAPERRGPSAFWRPEDVWAPVQRGNSIALSHVYDAQRSIAPVAWRDLGGGQGHWCVFGFDDVVAVLGDPKRFSSAVPKFGTPMIPIEVDPPTHFEYRRLLAGLINPARLKRYETQIRDYVGRRLKQAFENGEPDFVDITASIALLSFCLLAGEADPEAWATISARREQENDARLGLLDAASIEKRKAAAQPIADYCRREIEKRKTQPADDLVNDIVYGQVEGRPVTDDEALSILMLLFIAGHRTTTAALRGIVVQMARNPDMQTEIRSSSTRMTAAQEEILRLETPVHALPRYCTEDTVVSGQLIAKGEQIFPIYGAANVDASAFAEPDKFDADRRPGRHVAFGRGIHICAGAPLARLQMKVFIEELLERGGTLELTGPVTRPAWPHFGAVSLPVRVSAR